jgi:hypothetical protein
MCAKTRCGSGPLARAWLWQRMLDEGVDTSVSEIGDTESIAKS